MASFGAGPADSPGVMLRHTGRSEAAELVIKGL
jgi:hypothetical protein